MIDNRTCKICDGGPGNDCACNCGMELWEDPKPQPAFSFDQVEAELSRRIATCHSAREDATNTRQRDKQAARAQALSEMLAWVRFQRKLK